MAAQPNQIAYGSQSPQSAGDLNYWQLGDIVLNNVPATAVDFVSGWICVAAGNPGTWSAMTVVPTTTVTTTATSGTLTNGFRMTLLNPATTGTYSLPAAQANAAGTFQSYKNLASGSVTLTPLASNSYADAAAVTLTQFQLVTLMSNGGTTWYKGA